MFVTNKIASVFEEIIKRDFLISVSAARIFFYGLEFIYSLGTEALGRTVPLTVK